MNFKLMILASEPKFAAEAQEAGIDRIFFDLEILNKAERQKGRDTVLSHNNINELPSIRKVLSYSKLLVRTNPINPNLQNEIETIINYGADILMLPMAYSSIDAQKFVELVGGRAKVCVMIETSQALARIDNILNVQGIDELFFGLNDLHISLGLSFMFELLSGGLVEYLAKKCIGKKMPFGFGGIARIGDGILPAEKILGEHLRLGSESVILSRTFKGINNNKIDLKNEVAKVKKEIRKIHRWDTEQFINNSLEIKEITNNILK